MLAIRSKQTGRQPGHRAVTAAAREIALLRPVGFTIGKLVCAAHRLEDHVRQTIAVGDFVSQAQAAVPPLDYMFADGRQLPQTTRPDLIATMLRMLRAGPGHRILEVGTGSGYSTALLAHIAGPAGQVTSIDIDPELTERAADLLNGRGNAQVSLICADGRDGWAPAAPYDRLIAWASSPTIPPAWPQQVAPGGLIVAPIRQNPTGLVTAYQVAGTGSLQQLQQIKAGFVPLTPEPFRPWENDL